MKRTRTPKSVEQKRQILGLIARRPATAADLSEATGVHDTTVKALLKQLREEERVHVADWEWTPGATRATRMYLAGKADDAPYPPKRVMSAWPPVKERDLTPTHGWAPIRKANRDPVIQRDPFVAALFGEYRSGVAA